MSESFEQGSHANLRASRRSTPAPPDRLPPYSSESEIGILSCIFQEPSDSLDACIGALKDGAEEIYDLRHRVIYETMLAMYDELEAIDLITVQQRLRDKQQLEAVGGLSFLATIPDFTPSAANLTYYLEIVHGMYLRRKLIRTCTDIVGKVYEFEGEISELIDKVENDVLAVSESRGTSDIAPQCKPLVHLAINKFEFYHQNAGKLIGLSTGLADLDKATSGLVGPDVIVIAARPGLGKTSLAMNIAEHVSVDQKEPVGVFSLEMSGEQLMERLICSRARVNYRDLKEGVLLEGDFRRLSVAASQLSTAPLHIDDTAGISIMALKSKARRMKKKFGIKLFVIDYLQLVTVDSKKNQTRERDVAEISAGVKAIAKDLNVPIILLAQLNRKFEEDKNRKPRKSDLRESGAIEQDADIIGFLYEPPTEGEEVPVPQPVNLLIDKQRNGPAPVDVELMFQKRYTRFCNKAKVEPQHYEQKPKHQPSANVHYQVKPEELYSEEEIRSMAEGER